MENKRLFKLFAVISMFTIFSILLAACQLPASEGPPGDEETAGPTFPVPGETDQEMGGIDIDQINTQTAMAELMQTSVVVVDTPVPAVTEAPGGAEAPAPTQAPVATQAPAAVDIEPTPGIPASYTLQKGEWPFCIARRFDVNQYELLNINGLTLTSRPQVGYTLKIPQTGNGFAGEISLKNHPADYTVKAGETVYTIACAFGDVSPDMIGLANGISAPYEISAGQTLRIP
jgi:nucleoid-associated protein YgaU